MAIECNASLDEYSSPFFEENKRFCDRIEEFGLQYGGEVKGKFNAWSYIVYGKIDRPSNWNLKYKKASYTSGNLLLSSKYQSLLNLVEWSKFIGNKDDGLIIRKRKLWDFANNSRRLICSNNYVINIEDSIPLWVENMIEILRLLFEMNEVYKIQINKGVLKIELRTEKHHFKIFEKLLSDL